MHIHRAKLDWLTGQKYITLIKSDDPISILIERASSPRAGSYGMESMARIMVESSGNSLKINGERYTAMGLRSKFYLLHGLCKEAASFISIGERYFSDPDA